jgi:hypothetical protein
MTYFPDRTRFAYLCPGMSEWGEIESLLSRGLPTVSGLLTRLLCYPLSHFSNRISRFDTKAMGGKTFLNVGWLDSGHGFKKARLPENPRNSEFLNNLALYVQRPVITHRGFHECDFCPKRKYPIPEVHKGQRLKLGAGIFAVFGEGKKVFVSPTLIFHYVVAHNYQPPDEFIQAVLTQPLPGSPEYLERVKSAMPEYVQLFLPPRPSRRDRRKS